MTRAIRSKKLGLSLLVALLTQLSAPAWASNQGGGAALLVLAFIFVFPALAGIGCFVFSLLLTFVRPPAKRRRWRIVAILNLVLACVVLLGAFLGLMITGWPKRSSLGPWMWLAPTFSLVAIVLSATHLLAKEVHPKRWLILRLGLWVLPLLVPAAILGAGAVELSSERVRDRQLVQRLSGHFLGTYGVAYVDGGRALLAIGKGSSSGKSDVLRYRRIGERWQRDTGRWRLPSHPESVAIGPRHALIALRDQVWYLELEDPAKGRALPGCDAYTSAVAISPDGKLGAAAGQGDVWLWALPEGKLLRRLKPLPWRIAALAFSPDGALLASANAKARIAISEVATGTTRCTIEGKAASATVHALYITADGKRLLGGSRDGDVRSWDLRSCKQLSLVAQHAAGISAIARSSDGSIFAIGDNLSQIRLYRGVPTAEKKAVLLGQVSDRDNRHHLNAIRSIAFGPDGRTLAAGSWGNHQTIAIFRLPAH